MSHNACVTKKMDENSQSLSHLQYQGFSLQRGMLIGWTYFVNRICGSTLTTAMSHLPEGSVRIPL